MPLFFWKLFTLYTSLYWINCHSDSSWPAWDFLCSYCHPQSVWNWPTRPGSPSPVGLMQNWLWVKLENILRHGPNISLLRSESKTLNFSAVTRTSNTSERLETSTSANSVCASTSGKLIHWTVRHQRPFVDHNSKFCMSVFRHYLSWLKHQARLMHSLYLLKHRLSHSKELPWCVS